MRLGAIGDLIAHAGAELKATAIAELRLEAPCDAEENVSLLAPVVGAVPRRVLNHTDTNRAEVAGTRAGDAGFAMMFGRSDRGPIGGAKREVSNLHGPSHSSWLDVACRSQ